jgi:hypothetical protein
MLERIFSNVKYNKVVSCGPKSFLVVNGVVGFGDIILILFELS